MYPGIEYTGMKDRKRTSLEMDKELDFDCYSLGCAQIGNYNLNNFTPTQSIFESFFQIHSRGLEIKF